MLFRDIRSERMNMALYDLWTIYASVSVDGNKLGNFLIFAGDHDMGFQPMQKTMRDIKAGNNEYANNLKRILELAFPGSKITFFYFTGNAEGNSVPGGKYFK